MFLTLPIRDVLPETPRANLVRLDLAGQTFAFAAGQAVMLSVHGAEPRPISIACAPEDAEREGTLELLVGNDPGDGGRALSLTAHGTADVEGPFGAFTFPASPAERRFLFVAGGTGIAPLRGMLRHALVVPHDSIGVAYSARTSHEFAFDRELRALADRGRIELQQTVTRSYDPAWTGGRGRLTRDALAALVHDPATLCFVCGPEAFVEDLQRVLMAIGVPRSKIRAEGDPPLG